MRTEPRWFYFAAGDVDPSTGPYQKDRRPHHYRLANGRYERVDGEAKTWDLAKFTRETWTENHPVRRNLELTIALRHKIEHRNADATAVATAGYAQSLLLNFEQELTDRFGLTESIADKLRFPVFLGTFSREGAARIAAAQLKLPTKTKRFLTEFQSNLDPTIRDDARYEFRVHLVPKTGPKTDSDIAMTFVRADELSEEQLNALADIGHTGTVVVPEQIRDVANADKMKPGAAAKAIEARIPFRFSVYSHFPRAWRALGARPARKTDHPERTLKDFCVYDKPHGDYLYTDAFVARVSTECATDEGFERFIGIPPVRKVSPINAAQQAS